jgi:Cdc6-like AAA superfamily ATPase
MITRSDNQERQSIADWISSTNYSNDQAYIQKETEDGTGLWILRTTEFCDWLIKKGVLFCPGIPGAGKTFLSSMIINHLQETFQMNQDVGVAYIFCKYNQKSEQDTTSILPSILKQLVQASPLLLEDLRALYERRHRGQPRLQRAELCTMLEKTCQVYSRVYIVIDALDECSDSDRTRDDIISQLLDLELKCNVGLLVTSRSLPEIRARFCSFPTLEIRASDEDVKRFTENRISKLSPWVARDQALSSFIVSEILCLVNGMYASLVVSYFFLKANLLRSL